MSYYTNKITIEEAKNIIKNGKLYYPASSHYENSINPVNVYCDYCDNSMLKISIGYDNKDLCLSCVDSITGNESITPFEKYKYGNEESDKYIIVTNMAQDSVRKRLHINTPLGDSQSSKSKFFQMIDNFRADRNKYNAVTRMSQDSVRK